MRPSAVLDFRLLALLAMALAGSPSSAEQPDHILYFTHSAGYRHEVIPLSQDILRQVGKKSNLFEITATDDVSVFTTENLRRYAAVIFYTSGELPMSDAQKAALLDYIRSGSGFLGVHSAIDTFPKWPDYLKLIGGHFDGHPWHQDVAIDIVDPANSLVAFLGALLKIDDEIYQISDFDDQGSRVLLRLDQSSVDLAMSDVHRRSYGWPLAWTRAYGAGRVFYTALGHEEAVWRDPRYQQLLLNAVLWTIRRSP